MSYGSWLVITCLGIAPCYAISELLFGIPEWFTMSGYCTMLCNSWIDRLFRNHLWLTWLTDIVSSRDPPDLKIVGVWVFNQSLATIAQFRENSLRIILKLCFGWSCWHSETLNQIKCLNFVYSCCHKAFELLHNWSIFLITRTVTVT